MSLDGFVAGPDDGLGRGLGEDGEPIHDWVMGGSWSYGDVTPFAATGVDREVVDEMFATAGAVIVGRRMYDVVDGWGGESGGRGGRRQGHLGRRRSACGAALPGGRGWSTRCRSTWRRC